MESISHTSDIKNMLFCFIEEPTVTIVKNIHKIDAIANTVSSEPIFYSPVIKWNLEFTDQEFTDPNVKTILTAGRTNLRK